VSSVATAAKGFGVIAYDPDPARAEALRAGRLPIVEPGLPELLAAHGARIRFTADPAALADCPLIICAADVPTDRDNRSDLSVIRMLLDTVAAHGAPGTTLVVLSQVPPGFTREVAETRRRVQPQRHLDVCYQVETLIVGRAADRALTPERFIVGCRNPRAPLPAAYAEWLARFACPVFTMRYESAELAKIAVNLFLVSSVSTANTLAELCEALGADWAEMIPALQADRRIGPHAYLQPGLGLGGGNLERDLATVRELASRHGTEAGIVDAWLANSAHRREWVLTALHDTVLWAGRDPLIAVWGLAYKPQTHSTKNSPTLHLLDALRPCAVTAYDPQARLPENGFAHVRQAAGALEACQGADALAILTAWPAFASIDPAAIRARLRGRLVLDPLGILDGRRCAEAGLSYRRLGAPAERLETVPC